MHAAYNLLPSEPVANTELDALEAGATTCGTTRPETLGHQRCWRAQGHEGPHKSQDSQSWLETRNVQVSVESVLGDFEPTGVLFEAELVGSAPYVFWHAVVVPQLTEAQLYEILERVRKTTGVGWEPGHRTGQVFLAPAYQMQAVTR